MPSRSVPIVTDQVYHVFNRSVSGVPIFTAKKDCYRFLDLVDYYRFLQPQIRFSFYNRADKQLKQSLISSLHTSQQQITILAYAIMPNHYHFVLKQEREHGISNFMRILQNSYAKYFNIRHKRFGALFQSMFKYVRIATDEQFLHVVRYVHLNPVTSYVIGSLSDLENYPWTSYRSYISDSLYSMVNTDEVLSHFKTIESFKKFTEDQVEYQRTLAECKHLYHDSDV